jgi:N-methylhydantoinase A
VTSEAGAPVVGVDIGGTFTDLVCAVDGKLSIHKVPSTPAAPAVAFLRGLAELQVRGELPNAELGRRYVHGSTVATNAVLERRGARAALLTTAGFRDILELGRQTRLELYALAPSKHVPLVPRERCFEVLERVDQHGDVLEPLDEAALKEALDAIVASGAESLAIVFLFGFANPAHEQRAGELARARGLQVSLSSEILPEYREYERASTTAANAYVAPLMSRYLRALEEHLHRLGPHRLQVMQSSGGVISVDTACREAVRTLLSGPAGGLVGAQKVAAQAGFDAVISFDMGGTSTDVALCEGEPLPAGHGTISHLPIRIPLLDIHTVGAGGGSIARMDLGGGLCVGPQSAGADPGPAAYGKGTLPTVSDANLVLGRLDPSAFLGGRLALHPDRSLAAISALATQLGLSPEDTAEGVVRVVNVQMARALRKVSVERGHDPRRFCLVAFGGSGPLHACELAEETGIESVLVPRFPGILSALGMLLCDIRKEYSRTWIGPAAGDLAVQEPLFRALERQAEADLEAEGVPASRRSLQRWIDLRYRGQSSELSLPAPEAGSDLAERLCAGFHTAHARRYGYATPETPCEIVTLRVRAVGRVDAPELPAATHSTSGLPPSQKQCLIRYRGRRLRCPVYSRAELDAGQAWAGPALVTQEDATTWVPPRWEAQVDVWYNVVIRRARRRNRATGGT